MLPRLLNRDVGRPPFEDVQIIGAGSGNDVQAALSHGAKRIDAVEIDPVLYEIGRADHPDRPYDDPRVTIHLDDGRSFVRKVDRTYDLVVYALVDSLVLHSGYSSLRLESFLFTEQAFKDIKARLMPNGVFAMYNFYRQG
jgi:spermidine synthase